MNGTGETPPVQDTQYLNILTPILFSIITIAGLPGNLLVIWVVLSNKAMYSVTNLLIVSLAIADLLFIVICVPLTTFRYVHRHWLFGVYICKIYQYMINVSVYSSVYTLVLMSLDRLLAVVYPIASMSLRTLSRCLKMLLLTWAIILCTNIPHFQQQGITEYTYQDENRSDCVNLLAFRNPSHLVKLNALFLVFGYILPLFLISVMYGYLLASLSPAASSHRCADATVVASASAEDATEQRLAESRNQKENVYLAERRDRNCFKFCANRRNRDGCFGDCKKRKKQNIKLKKIRSDSYGPCNDDSTSPISPVISSETNCGSCKISSKEKRMVVINAVPSSSENVRARSLSNNVGLAKLRRKRRVTKMVIVVILTFALCWLPNHLIFITVVLQEDWTNSEFFVALQTIANALAYLNSCLNPFLYAFLSEHFRAEFNKFFCRNKNFSKKERAKQNAHCSGGLETLTLRSKEWAKTINSSL